MRPVFLPSRSLRIAPLPRAVRWIRLCWRGILPSALCGLLAACVYRLDIPQGNPITADQVTQLKPGMSRAQVIHLLGTPLLQDPFHPDRWDYLYEDRRQGDLLHRYHYVVTFRGDRLAEMRGDTLPAHAEDVLAPAPFNPRDASH